MGLHEDIHHAKTIEGIDIFIGATIIATRPPIVVTNEKTNTDPSHTRAPSPSSSGGWTSLSEMVDRA